jgi:Tol biopolymer transport system component
MVKAVPDGNERTVGHCGVEAYTARLSWAHDGTALYFADQPATMASWRIRKLSLVSGTVIDITHPRPGAGDWDADISPDGERLAFVRHEAGDIKDVFVQYLPSDKLLQVTRDGASLYTAWAADGQSLFVTSWRSGNSDLWSVAADGSGASQRVLVGLTGLGRTSSAQDMLAVELWRRRSNIVIIRDGRQISVTSGDRSDFAPEFSSHGVLAFFSATGGLALWVQPPGNPPTRLLKLDVQTVSSPRWSPDGKTIAFIGHAKDRCVLFLVKAESAEMRRYSLPDEDTNAPAWDGSNTILYPARSGGRWHDRLFDLTRPTTRARASIDGWQEVRVTDGTMYGVKQGLRGIWRLYPSSPPTAIAPEFDGDAAPDGWTIVNGRLYTIELRKGVHNAGVLRRMLDGGGTQEPARGLDWADDTNNSTGGLAVDPVTGTIVYAKNGAEDTDIGLLHLVRR